ncbi:response regulator transcription factor [Candidatus Bipolaricaulota bacterium]|nr:response regulator transcription factor [Candidatus Bipolaricaulota bacterium]MBS3792717.1 response regulator transcription factor [Candidatus Bipolaricaulota bacterium]
MSEDGEKIELVIVDDHRVVRSGVKALIDTEPHLEVIGEAADGREAVTKVKSQNPDVVLMDLVMPEMDGVEATSKITKVDPAPKILILTSFSEEERIIQAIKAGATGYLIKDASPDELVQAIKDVYHGESTLDPKVAGTVLRSVQNEPQDSSEDLTDREVEVLELLAEGLPNEDIAEKLYISERTVRSHVSNILAKLDLTNRTQAALYAVKKGIVELK